MKSTRICTKLNQRLLEPPHGMMGRRDELFENALKANLVLFYLKLAEK